MEKCLQQHFSFLLYVHYTQKKPYLKVNPKLKLIPMCQFERYQSELTNAKGSFGRITQVSPLTSEQKRLLTNVTVKQNWSNRVQIVGAINILDKSVNKQFTKNRELPK